jgi:ferric-dicitrate binding protein FerR (iron transport regulator)
LPYQVDFENEIKANIEKNILKEESTEPIIKFINRRFIKAAVAAAIFIGIVFSLIFFYKTPPKVPDPALVVVKSNREKSEMQEDRKNKVQQKENRVVFLPDGSKVILSPGSKLNYPSSFDGVEKREVFLVGQAFFDVKHNPSRRFIVHTGKLETIVLGTVFNIKALHGEKEITITVARGKVKVKDQNKILGTITPNQQIVYNKGNVTSTQRIVNNESYLDWINQDLLINNLTLSEAAKILEEQFKIKIIIRDPSIREQRFTATFPKDEKLDQALKSITIFNGVTYTYNNDKSEVIIK